MATHTIRKSKLIREKKAERAVFATGPLQKNPLEGVYIKSLLSTKILLSITEIGKNITPNLIAKITSKYAGRCVEEGYIKPRSIVIISYSSGNIMAENIEFHVVFQCMVCLPVEGMWIECVCKTITKAGIHAQVIDEDGNMPVTIFVARDHHHIDRQFGLVKENNKILVRVIGIRYELNDAYICAIAKLMDIVNSENQEKPRIHIMKGGEENIHFVEDVDDVEDEEENV